MSRKDKLIKSKSIYTVRSKHTTTVNGTIYENDNVTIIPNDGIFNEDMPLFSESNFKFRIGTGNSGRKKHSRGGWISVDGSDNNVWTLNNLPIQGKTDEGHVVIKPNYSSLKDFVYYGSAVELIKGTINDLIMRYPGGISYYQTPPEVLIGENRYYLISNEYNIDFWTPVGISSNELENPMRVLGASYMNYEGVTYSGDTETGTYDVNLNICITGNCVGSIIGAVCFQDLSDNELVYSKGRDIVLGAGQEEDEEFNFWTTMEVHAYSGVSEYNYLPNVPISNVNIDMEVVDINGRSESFSGITNRDGIASFPRKLLTTNLDGCLVKFYVTGTINGETFTGKLDYECETEYQPVVNLYINFQEMPTNKYPYTVFVKDSLNYTALENIEVVFYANLVFKDNSSFNDGFYCTGRKTTDTTGIVELYGKESEWYLVENDTLTPVSSGIAGQYYIMSWYSEAYYEDEPIRNIEGEQLYNSNTANIYIKKEENVQAFSTLEVVGKLGMDNNIGAGYNAMIEVFDGNGVFKQKSGITNANGSFIVSYDEFKEIFPKTYNPIGFNCSITYDDITLVGNKVYFNDSINPESYSQTLYFKETPVGNEIKLYTTAFTVFQGIKTPIPNLELSFSATSEKLEISNSYFTITARTNSDGVTMVSTSDNWICHNTVIDNLQMITKWRVSTEISGTTYNGEGGFNNITNGDVSDVILVNENANWNNLTVSVINTSEEPIYNAVVKVYAKSNGQDEWMYYSLKSTDSSGKAIFTPSSRWIHINGTSTATTNQFDSWKCEASVNDESQISGELSIETSGYTFRFNIEVNPVTGSSYNCDILSSTSENVFYIYLDGSGKKYLLANQENYHNGHVIIRPKSKYIEEFWSNLDDFEKVLLDRTTKPIYKARLETPYIENNRHYYEYKNYIWPTVDGINPDLTSSVFQTYLNSLLDIAEYYDEYEADNLWRMMTHESIKNLDWSFIRHNGEDAVDTEDIDIDSSRMQAMLRIQSRVFDDIKRYADNIKTVNSITYDEKNNIPDYFLSDILELNGLEAKNVSNFSGLTSDIIYTATTSVGRTDSEVNSDFMRRLALNAKYLMSMKGTRRGVEGILGMFGYISGVDYTISEYVSVARNFPNYKETSALRILGENEYINYDTNTNKMVGYPVGVISPAIEEPTEDDYYLVPWMNKNIEYDNNIYFQEKGGWGRKHSKSINLSITTANEINDDNFDFKIYDETIPYIRYVDTISDMTSLSNALIYQNMVCYVNDISDISDNGGRRNNRSVSSDTGATTQNIEYSHYFVLKNTALSSYVGFVDNDLYHCYGWRNIPVNEFKNGATTEDGLRVLYLESLIMTNKGNNPHCGFGGYDDGDSYIHKYNTLFSTAIDEGKFEYLKDGDEIDQQNYDKILSLGFDVLNYCEDNKKCHYFEKDGSEIIYGNEETLRNGFNTALNSHELHYIETENGVEIGDVAVDGGGEYSGTTIDGEFYSFINPENSGRYYEEAAANSVINTKNLLIKFSIHNNGYFKKYLEDVVLKYLIEMIPSTTILKYEFEDEMIGQSPIAIDTSETYGTTRSIVGEGVTSDAEFILFEDNTGLINNDNNNRQ